MSVMLFAKMGVFEEEWFAQSEDPGAPVIRKAHVLKTGDVLMDFWDIGDDGRPYNELGLHVSRKAAGLLGNNLDEVYFSSFMPEEWRVLFDGDSPRLQSRSAQIGFDDCRPLFFEEPEEGEVPFWVRAGTVEALEDGMSELCLYNLLIRTDFVLSAESETGHLGSLLISSTQQPQ